MTYQDVSGDDNTASRSLRTHRDFRQLWVAQSTSQAGTHITKTAMPLLAAVSLAASPAQMGLLTAAQEAAFLIIGLHAGVWVDRLRRRSVMIVADIARCLLLLSVPIAWWFEFLTMWQLIIVALVMGAFTTFFDVAYQSYLPFLVSREKLLEANGKLESTQSIARVSGPVAGGWLTQLFGAANAILLNVISYAVSALYLLRIQAKEPTPKPSPKGRQFSEIRHGLRFVLDNKNLRALVVTTATNNLFFSVIVTVAVLFLTQQLGLSPGIVGLLMASGSIGALAGAFTSRLVTQRIGNIRTIWIILLVTQPFILLMPLTGAGWSLLLYPVAYFSYSYGTVVFNVAQVTYRQSICPAELLGRMNATIRFFVWGTLPLGGLLGGLLGEVVGIHAALWVGTFGVAISPIFLLFSPLRTRRADVVAPSR